MQPPGGQFEAIDFPRLLYRYLVCGVTGRLRFRSGEKRLDLFLNEGRAEAVSTHGTGDIGDYLVQSGLMDQTLLNQMRAAAGKSSLYGLLLRTETLNHHQLTRTRSGLRSLKSGFYLRVASGQVHSFYAGKTPSDDALSLDALVYLLINEGIEELMDPKVIMGFFSGHANPSLVRMRHRHLDLSNLLLSTRQLRDLEQCAERQHGDGAGRSPERYARNQRGAGFSNPVLDGTRRDAALADGREWPEGRLVALLVCGNNHRSNPTANRQSPVTSMKRGSVTATRSDRMRFTAS